MCGAATAKARLPTADSLTGGTAKRLALIVIIYIFIRINCSIKNNKFKKTMQKETHNVSKNTTHQMHTITTHIGSAR